MLKSLRYFDWLLLTGVMVLTLIGLMMIYSTGLTGSSDSGLWTRQALALLIGLLGLFFFSSVDYHYFQKASGSLYVAAILLLVGVLIFGSPVRGSVRWFDLGLLNFQPAEFSKVALLVMLAGFLSVRGAMTQRFSYVLWTLLYAVIPMVLIIRQPDLGSAMVHGILWLGLLLLSPMPKRYFLYLLVGFLIVSVFAWQFFLHDYQKDRVRSFLDPASDPLGRGYNVIQSMVAVGSGGLYGTGLARGLQSQLRFLPERQTDFIFASTVEELGLVGGVGMIVLIIFVLLRTVRVMRRARDSFGTYLAGGIFFLFFSQAAINIGMNVGLLPVTGITLPFVSYGGSSLMVSFWLVGVLQSVARGAVPVRFS